MARDWYNTGYGLSTKTAHAGYSRIEIVDGETNLSPVEKTPKLWPIFEETLKELTQESDADAYNRMKTLFKEQPSVPRAIQEEAHWLRQVCNEIRHKGYRARDTDYIKAVKVVAEWIEHFSGVLIFATVKSIYDPKTGFATPQANPRSGTSPNTNMNPATGFATPQANPRSNQQPVTSLNTDMNGPGQEAYRKKYAGELKKANDCFSQIQMVAEETQSLKTVLEKNAALLEGKEWCKELRPHLSNILTELTQTLESLRHPCLKIAFVGTTSSGKSTLLNALAGHRIAPMEAGEMSAGVVRIRNDAKASFVVHPTDYMAWSLGAYTVRNDEDIYKALRDKDIGIMYKYWAATEKNAEVMAPNIEITVQLAPKNGGIPKFEMPASIGLEFYDLPGLKSVTDSKNLKVIQEHLASCFLLIVLNYSETDSEKRKRLLDEIKKIVQDICRNKEALIFVLNRVDERNSEDNPLEERISSLKEDIRKILELADPPEIIPMSALPLYLVQTAWGCEGEPIYAKSDELAKKSRSQLEKFFDDCPKIIKSISKESEEKRLWFRNHDEANLAEWDKDDVPQLLHWIYEYSGAYRFWETLQRKLNEQIGPIIINPALGGLPAHLCDFSVRLTDLAGILTISTREEIQKAKDDIEAFTAEIKKKLENFKKEFNQDFKQSVEACKSKEAERIERIKYPQFKEMRTVLQQISDDIHDTIMIPIRNALVKEDIDELYKLEQTLAEVIPKELALHIKDSVNNLLMAGYEVKGQYFKCPLDDKEKHTEKIQKLKRIENRRLHLAGYVDKAMEKRSQFLLQERMLFFQDVTKHIMEDSMKVLSNSFKGQREGLDFRFTLPTSRDVNMELPSGIFNDITIKNAERIMKQKVIIK